MFLQTDILSKFAHPVNPRRVDRYRLSGSTELGPHSDHSDDQPSVEARTPPKHRPIEADPKFMSDSSYVCGVPPKRGGVALDLVKESGVASPDKSRSQAYVRLVV